MTYDMKTHLMKLTAFVAVMLSCATAMAGVGQHPSLAKGLVKGVADSLSITNTSIAFGDKVLLHDMDISIAALDSTAVPELDFGMFNVSVEGEGYRFLPHGTHFDGEGATVRLKYDRTRIPSGYTEDDIRTYYFDPDRKCWVALPRVEVDKQSACVVSKTTHFTDMINGVIVAPESPETDAFTPTMMNDIKAADPTSKINIIMPPTANNRGSANLTYPFEMPPARNGMQPQLALSYNSDGGSGWAGEGWDISIPAITVDTRWGVPRYNILHESETYLLNGQMLAMMKDTCMTVAHRDSTLSRVADRQFFLRQGGDFSKIVRKGNSLDSYYWEITDRNGVVYTYGGNDNAVLKDTITDVHGNRRLVAAEWKLTRVQETHGDYMVYEYENKTTTSETVLGGLTTHPVYLSKIHVYQMKEDSTYLETSTIVFHPYMTNGNYVLKSTQHNNARYGFLTSSNRLLRYVEVKFLNERLRLYRLDYTRDTTFHVDQLKMITHLDNNNHEVASQTFDYYDDVTSENEYVPYESNSQTKSLPSDNLDANFLNPVSAFGIKLSDEVSGLGGSKSVDYYSQAYVGAGLNDMKLYSKSNTYGMSFSYTNGKTSGVSTLIDIDGDGVLDKVFIEDSKLKYRSGITSRVVVIDDGIKNFQRTKTQSISGGFKAHPSIGKITTIAGVDALTSKSKTDTYFSDVNGDGLVDIVVNNKVHFNTTKYVNGVLTPSFSLYSSETPSPIFNAGVIDSSDTEVTEEERQEALLNSPMEDMVRVWIAPHSGLVNINSSIALLPPSGDEDDDDENTDGVYVSIQKNEDVLWFCTIDENDFNNHPANLDSISVSKGDRIYFRLQSGNLLLSNGACDSVIWNPEIEYVDKPYLITPNGHKAYTFNSMESEVVSVSRPVPVLGTSDFRMTGSFVKPQTSDNITLCIYASNDRYDESGNVNTNYYRRLVCDTTFSWNQPHNGNLIIPLNIISTDEYVDCEMNSSTNVAWEKVKWLPVVQSDSDSIAVGVKCSVYADIVNRGTIAKARPQDSITVTLNSFSSNGGNGNLTLAVKSKNKLYYKGAISVINNTISGFTPFTITTENSDSLWVELYTADSGLANSITRFRLSFNSSIEGISRFVNASIFAISNEDRFGPLYRGWGQFIYNTGADDRYNHKIFENLLALPNNANDTVDVRTWPFSVAMPDLTTQSRWYGPNHDIFITGQTMGASRMGEKDVDLKNPLANLGEVDIHQGTKWSGSTARGITLISTSISDDVMANASTVFPFISPSITANVAYGSSKNKTAFLDLNGDNYPDIITENKIQYTNTLGGFNNEQRDGVGYEEGSNLSVLLGLGATALHSFSIGSKSGVQDPPANESQLSSESSRTGNLTFDMGLNLNLYNQDLSKSAFIDINGDGLPDMVKDNGTVRINMGYSFTEPIQCGIESIQITKNEPVSLSGELGGGIDILKKNHNVDVEQTSIAAGIGLNGNSSKGKFDIMDVNGDGLPDLVKKNNGISVSLNLGNRFDNWIPWRNMSDIRTSASTTESAKAAFTLGFTNLSATLKFSINSMLSFGHSMSRPNYELKDLNGDGFLDILESNSEDELKVRYSTIARTNKLKTVTNSLGGSFTIDYEHSTPTYWLPGGKWVMSSVEVDYGLDSTDYYIPRSKTAFEYNGGRRDRHEREFLGFAEVISKQLDTEDDDALYRKTVELYDTASIYTAGNLIGNYVQDSSDVKFSEVHNDYYLYGLTNEPSNFNGGKYKYSESFDTWNDRGVAYTPLKYTVNKQEGQVMSEEWNDYYVGEGDHGLLHSYKYSDKGMLGENGNGGYDYKTSINYTCNLSGNNHIFGLPFKVTVSNEDEEFHEVIASYNTKYPNHILSIRRHLDNNRDLGYHSGNGTGEVVTINEHDGIPYTVDYPDTEEDPHILPLDPSATYATTSYHYDNFGNIDTVALPRGNDNTRVWYKYQYDDTLNTYLTQIDDVFDLSSRTDWFDYRYGISNHREDQNGVHYHTTTDNLGRLTSVTSPNELPNGSNHRDPSITFEYYPKMVYENGRCIPAHAITTYYFRRKYKYNSSDKKDVKSMRIVTFVDGFGRVIETRKEAYIHNQ